MNSHCLAGEPKIMRWRMCVLSRILVGGVMSKKHDKHKESKAGPMTGYTGLEGDLQCGTSMEVHHDLSEST